MRGHLLGTAKVPLSKAQNLQLLGMPRQRWDKVIVLQVTSKPLVFAFKSQVKSQDTQVLSQVKSPKLGISNSKQITSTLLIY